MENISNLEKLQQMQLDCHKATAVMTEVQDFLNITLSDSQLNDWIYDGFSILYSHLFIMASGRSPLSFKNEIGYYVTEEFTDDHHNILENKYGLKQDTVSHLMGKLIEISEINYFDMRAVNGFYIIHESEFTGMGVTGLCVTSFAVN